LLSDDGIVAIATHCFELEFLELFMANITDLSLFEISNNCSNLEFLEISKCKKITDDGLIAPATNCLKLKELSCGWVAGVKVTLKNLHEIIIPKAIKKKIKNLIIQE
jgi:hypothetical protein